MRIPKKATTWLRWLLGGVLLIGVCQAGSRYPVVPEETWPEPHVYEPTDEICHPARDERQWAFFEIPQSLGRVTAADVAERFLLEPGPVCRANEITECAGRWLAPGRRLVLPLSYDEETLAAARRAARESGEGG